MAANGPKKTKQKNFKALKLGEGNNTSKVCEFRRRSSDTLNLKDNSLG